MVQQSFNALFAIMITVALFACGTFAITGWFDTELFALIQTVVQKPWCISLPVCQASLR
jgi:cellobiose-specific phosphotransferase system component IIC